MLSLSSSYTSPSPGKAERRRRRAEPVKKSDRLGWVTKKCVATRGLAGHCAPPPHVFPVFAHAGFNPETRGREIQ